MTAQTGTTFEYATVRVNRDLENLYQDTYRSLGWTVESREDPLASGVRPLHERFARGVPLVGQMYGHTVDALPHADIITLRLKRDRYIPNRPQVEALQRQAEQALARIDRLERSKSSRANTASISLGLVGAAFLAGSVFSLGAGMTALMVVLGAIGLIVWLAALLAHGAVKRNRTAKVAADLDSQYAVVYSASEEAHSLLG